MSKATEYREDAIIQDGNTTPEDVERFVENSIATPYEINEVTVWNLNNHEVDYEALVEVVTEDLYREKYVIPHQMAGVWAYIVHLLPKELVEAEYLVYSESEGEYRPSVNYMRFTSYPEILRKRVGMKEIAIRSTGGGDVV